jgi:hypothetical protein
LRVRAGSTATPPAISASPLTTTHSRFHWAMRGGTIASYWRGIAKCRAPATTQKMAVPSRAPFDRSI